MYVDSFLELSSAQAVTATAASTNYIDLSEARDIGQGQDVYVVCNVTTTMDDASDDSTITLTLETDDNTSFSSATTAQTIGTFAAVSAAGSRLIAKLQPSALNERYLRGKYTTANGDLSAGAFDLFLTTDIDAYVAYADNVGHLG